MSEWQPVLEGDLSDLWVVTRPRDGLWLTDAITVEVRAESVYGEQLDPLVDVVHAGIDVHDGLALHPQGEAHRLFE